MCHLVMLPLPPIFSASTFRPCQAVALREAVHRFGGDHPDDHFWAILGHWGWENNPFLYENLWKIYENL